MSYRSCPGPDFTPGRVHKGRSRLNFIRDYPGKARLRPAFSGQPQPVRSWYSTAARVAGFAYRAASNPKIHAPCAYSHPQIPLRHLCFFRGQTGPRKNTSVVCRCLQLMARKKLKRGSGFGRKSKAQEAEDRGHRALGEQERLKVKALCKRLLHWPMSAFRRSKRACRQGPRC